jgi:hypothetical protein
MSTVEWSSRPHPSDADHAIVNEFQSPLVGDVHLASPRREVVSMNGRDIEPAWGGSFSGSIARSDNSNRATRNDLSVVIAMRPTTYSSAAAMSTGIVDFEAKLYE